MHIAQQVATLRQLAGLSCGWLGSASLKTEPKGSTAFCCTQLIAMGWTFRVLTPASAIMPPKVGSSPLPIRLIWKDADA